jgi:hypothetical protein
MTFVVMAADCTNAYVNWYRSRYRNEVDRSLVLPVLKALLGHLEVGVLMNINKVIEDIDTAYTRYERSS